MNQFGSSNENNSSIQSMGSSPVTNESDILATKDKSLNHPFAKPIKTFTNFSNRFGRRPEIREISLNQPNVNYPITDLFNSGYKATEIKKGDNGNDLQINNPQPLPPTLIFKEYDIYQSYLKTPGNFHQNSHQKNQSEEKESIVRSKSGEIPLKILDIPQKKKPGSKRKIMEPVLLNSSRHKFPNRPYVPYDEIIGYVDDIQYDHFGSREDRKSIENENPNNKIIELMNKIQSIAQHKYEKEEKEISRKFEIVTKNPIDILIINQKKFTNNDQNVTKPQKIQINNNIFKTVILPAPIIRSLPYHAFLWHILKNESEISKKIFKTTSKIMSSWNRLKAFKTSDISKYSTFIQLANEIWPRIYQETERDKYPEHIDIKSAIEKYHKLFLIMEAIDMNYYSELSNISFNPHSLITFNYNPSMIFD